MLPALPARILSATLLDSGDLSCYDDIIQPSIPLVRGPNSIGLASLLAPYPVSLRATLSPRAVWLLAVAKRGAFTVLAQQPALRWCPSPCRTLSEYPGNSSSSLALAGWNSRDVRTGRRLSLDHVLDSEDIGSPVSHVLVRSRRP